MREVWKKNKKLIIFSVVILAIVTVPLVIYAWGEFCLALEIAWLKKHGRPTTWEEFYRQYPLTPVDAPEYKQLQQAFALMPKHELSWNWYPSGGMFGSPSGQKLEKEKQQKDKELAEKNLRDTAEFRSCMYKLLEMQPVKLKNEGDNSSPEKYVFYFFQNFEMEHFSRALKDCDFSDAIAIIDHSRNNWLAYGSNSGWLMSFYGLPRTDRLLELYEVSEDVLRKWRSNIAKDVAFVIKDVRRIVDLHNVKNINEPVVSYGYHCLRGSRRYPLSAALQFSVPYWRARQLAMMRQGETTFNSKYVVNRQRENYFAILCIIPFDVLDKIFSNQFCYMNYVRSLFYDDFSDDNAAMCRGRVYFQVMDTGLAVELYRRKYGKLPEKLADMVPDFIREVPNDPFDGLPLDYTASYGEAYRIAGRGARGSSSYVFEIKNRPSKGATSAGFSENHVGKDH